MSQTVIGKRGANWANLRNNSIATKATKTIFILLRYSMIYMSFISDKATKPPVVKQLAIYSISSDQGSPLRNWRDTTLSWDSRFLSLLIKKIMVGRKRGKKELIL